MIEEMGIVETAGMSKRNRTDTKGKRQPKDEMPKGGNKNNGFYVDLQLQDNQCLPVSTKNFERPKNFFTH